MGASPSGHHRPSSSVITATRSRAASSGGVPFFTALRASSKVATARIGHSPSRLSLLASASLGRFQRRLRGRGKRRRSCLGPRWLRWRVTGRSNLRDACRSAVRCRTKGRCLAPAPAGGPGSHVLPQPSKARARACMGSAIVVAPPPSRSTASHPDSGTPSMIRAVNQLIDGDARSPLQSGSGIGWTGDVDLHRSRSAGKARDGTSGGLGRLACSRPSGTSPRLAAAIRYSVRTTPGHDGTAVAPCAPKCTGPGPLPTPRTGAVTTATPPLRYRDATRSQVSANQLPCAP